MTGKKLFELDNLIKSWGLSSSTIEDLSYLTNEEVDLILKNLDNDYIERLLKYFTESHVPYEVRLKAAEYFMPVGSNLLRPFNVSLVAGVFTLYENFGAEKYLELVSLASNIHQPIKSCDLIEVSFSGPKKIRYDLVKAIIEAPENNLSTCIGMIARNQLAYQKGITLDVIDIVSKMDSLKQARYATNVALNTTVLNRLYPSEVVDLVRLASTLEEGKKVEISKDIYERLIQGNLKNGIDVKPIIDRLFDVYEDVKFWDLYAQDSTEALYILKHTQGTSEQEISNDFLVRRRVKNT